MHRLFLILRRNVGDRQKILETAKSMIELRMGKIEVQSAVYQTEAWGFESSPFLNQVVVVDTVLTSAKALDEVQAIENELGRKRLGEGYQARTMDIDILFYDDCQILTETLQIPHPRIASRRFVLVPLCEIAAQKKHPVTGLTVNEMLLQCSDTLEVKPVEM